MRHATFWPAWSFLTVAAAMVTAWLFRHSACRVVREPARPRALRFGWSRGTVVPLAMLVLFLGGHFAMILVWEDFAWYDNSQFTAFSLRGIDFPVTVWPQGGRFFPLGLQEFNLIGHFTKTVAGYHAWPMIEVLVLALVLLILDDRLSIAGRVVLTCLALLTPSVAISFTGLIYPERDVLFLLVLLALFVKRFAQTRSSGWAVAAVVSAQIMLYLKEPVFLLLLSFAAARIILRSWNSTGAGWNFGCLRGEESRLDLCLAAVSLEFLAFYASMMFPYTSAEYLTIKHVSRLHALRFYINRDTLAWVFAAVVVVRMYRIFRGRAVPLLLWDALACGGVVYFGAYLGIGLLESYYLAPVDLIAVLYLGHLLYSSWGKMRLGGRGVAAALVVIVVCQNLYLSACWEFGRKYLIHRKAAIARILLEKYERDPGLVRKLYFPFADGYMLEEFAAYLSYRGVPVEDAGTSVKGARVEIFGAKIAKTGRCVVYRDFVCHAGPRDGTSMVIVLPDDPVPPAEMALYRESEAKLRSYDPRDQDPEWLLRVLQFLRVRG